MVTVAPLTRAVDTTPQVCSEAAKTTTAVGRGGRGGEGGLHSQVRSHSCSLVKECLRQPTTRVPVSLPHLHPLLCKSPGCQPSSLSFTLTLIWQQCTNVLHSVCLNRQHCSSAVIVVFRSFIVILILICTVSALRQLVNSIHCFSYMYSETCLKTATCGPVKTGHYRELGCIKEVDCNV